MTYYNEQLKILQQHTARKAQLEAMLRDLRNQRVTLSEKVSELQLAAQDEQRDVDQLEGAGIKGFFYGILGRRDEKLDEERAQAYAARLKYEAAARELEGTIGDIRDAEEELQQLSGCEEEYERLLQEKAQMLIDSGAPAAQEILALESKLVQLDGRRAQLQEAVEAGNTAMMSAQRAMRSLDSAESYSTWDMFGGGILVDMAKHNELDDAQAHINTLQSQLRHFKTELADVTIESDIQISVDSFLHFADFFFDGFLSNMAVMDKITQAQNKVDHTGRQIESVLAHLDQLLQENAREYGTLKGQLDHLIVHC